ncbi:hypothetical protein, conserved [Trypanosoma brucei gambiense DAL972]|uniref:FHA domain-containing protein n=2 Tax=Trypanosoma brucei TaxID=5691 RepID=C9ZMK1_TRYB9|nr:hypothetical protein, conserved [Trypanosoma brucei gambiense DAL972]RHW72878.1 hypothetical protein DPX39_040024400 [Trypanosoma brucei equiperdum]CBH10503.1 hypothetical protein, conserved [Trypanosoma brucei gambiense DAL972]|eukprot:XP_011772793.1 hypothetical protein, conserved [Trypanosoma brucei gambiense DAL972]
MIVGQMRRASVAGSSDSVLAIRSCFDNRDAVLFIQPGDGALLVADGHRYVQVILHFHGVTRFPSLIVLPWEQHRFSVRVNNVLYDDGPISLDVGDEIELMDSRSRLTADRCVFRVELLTTGRGPYVSELLANGNRTDNAVPAHKPYKVGQGSCWAEFVNHRVGKLDKVLSRVKR